MPTTSLNSLPYPALTDSPNVPLYMSNLANAVDPKLGMTMARRVVTTASGTLTTGASPLNIAASQTLPAAPFGAGVQYLIRVVSQIECSIPVNLGVRLNTIIGGVTYRSDEFTNGGSNTCTFTCHGDEMYVATVDTAITVSVQATALAGTITLSTTGGEIAIFATPYKAL